MEMARTHVRTAAALSLAAALLLGATACGDDDDGGGDDKSAPTASATVGESASSDIRDDIASASASASAALGDIRDGLDATSDVAVGPTSTKDDRTVAEVTATNGTDKKADYTVTVEFRDPGGNLLDTIVMNIDDVDPGKRGKGEARSNRDLSGTVKADIGYAVRH